MLEGYSIDRHGTIHHDAHTYNKEQYNIDYVKQRYDTYGDKNDQISYLRLGNVVSSIGYIPRYILDVGYGNGSFLKACQKSIPNCFGNDITQYPLPEKVEFISNIIGNDISYDVITFFDVLEHFSDLSFLEKINCRFVTISVPWCHYHYLPKNDRDKWFINWKHRRPEEHIWHFDYITLENLLSNHGFMKINHNNVEDCVRGSLDGLPNILTATFKNIK